MPWSSQFPFSGKVQTKFILYTVVYVPTRPALGLRLAFEPKGMSSSHQDLSPGESNLRNLYNPDGSSANVFDIKNRSLRGRRP